MAIKSASALKVDNNNLFNANGAQAITGELENEFNEDNIDSSLNRLDDIDQHNFKGTFNSTLSYVVGDIVTIGDRLLVCLVATSGTYTPTDWRDYNWNYDTSNLYQPTLTSNTLDLGGSERRFMRLGTGGVLTCDKIINGVTGRKYRVWLPVGTTDFSLVSSTVATAAASGLGELVIPFHLNTPTTYQNLKGYSPQEMSDWFEFVYVNDAGKEMNTITHIQKHIT